MTILRAFGCSHTYGHGLKDCVIDNIYPGEKPSSFAYPQVLADKLNVPCVNYSSPGASNKEIWNSIRLNYKFFSNQDIIIIGWSHVDRTCIIHSDNEISKIGAWDKKHKYWIANYYDEFDISLESLTYISHANLVFLQPNFKNFYNFTAVKGASNFNVRKIIKDIPWSIKLQPLKYSKRNDEKALDGMHPGESVHQRWADQIYEIIQKDIH